MEQKRKRKRELRKAFAAALPHTIPVLTGFIILGMAYGVLMQTKGYGLLWAVMMSAIAFCGSMQFVAITLLTAAFNPIQAFLLSLLVNARHLFYGLSMLEKYKGLGWIRNFLIYVLCDETFSISYSLEAPESCNRKYFFFAVSFLNYFYWILGTFLGSLLGNFIVFSTKGLDFVLTALFIVLFMEQWNKKENRASGMIGMLCTIFSLVIFGQENFMIPAMIFILLTLTAGRKRICT